MTRSWIWCCAWRLKREQGNLEESCVPEREVLLRAGSITGRNRKRVEGKGRWNQEEAYDLHLPTNSRGTPARPAFFRALGISIPSKEDAATRWSTLNSSSIFDHSRASLPPRLRLSGCFPKTRPLALLPKMRGSARENLVVGLPSNYLKVSNRSRSGPMASSTLALSAPRRCCFQSQSRSRSRPAQHLGRIRHVGQW